MRRPATRGMAIGWVLVLVWGLTSAAAAVLNVSTSGALQTAFNTAVAGDEIVLANGTYTGEYLINTNAGTALLPITVRALNPYQAILVGDNVCDRSHEGIVINKAYWVIRDLRFQDHGRALTVYTDNVTIHHNIIDHFKEEGIRVHGNANQARVQFTSIHHNVIANGDSCPGTDSPGIYLVGNTDNSSVKDNIVVATGNNGYQCAGVGGCSGTGDKFGYGLFLANNSDDNLIQGNLFLGNQGKGVLRILSDGTNSANADRNIVRDNAFLFGEGTGAVSDDCNEDSNQFLNNIAYGNYFWNWYVKGNLTGSMGHHLLQHNLMYATDFTRANVGFALNTIACSATGYKVANTVKDNVFYSDGAQTGAVDTRILLTLQGPQASVLAANSNNLFWAPGSTSTWVNAYTYAGTDIHATGSPPLFADPVHGDFSLLPGSPGLAAASDGTDMGIQYNSSLKKRWLAYAFALPTQQHDSLTTSTTFTVDPAHWYQIWFWIPTAAPFAGIETFVVEGDGRQRDIQKLVTDTTWTQPGGPARWITLGRAKATDGTLNITWTNAGSASKVFIRQLPTADEAYQWMIERRGRARIW
jgi:hypothetical protein